MNRRILHIGSPSYLSAKYEQLVIRQVGAEEAPTTVHAEDISAIILDNPQITITNYCINLLEKKGIAIVVCGENHMPSGLMTPLDGNTLQTLRFRRQVELKEPIKKGLWKSIIKYKILNQAATLELFEKEATRLKVLAREVKSGDSTNREGAASAYYWKELFGEDFIRDYDGGFPNSLLNYGYAIMRSMCAKYIVGAGLHPTIGLFHKNQYNSYCLADDIMEPYRPLVDRKVYEMTQNGMDDMILTKEQKRELIGILLDEVVIEEETKTVQIAINQTVDSLVRSVVGGSIQIEYPKL